MKIWRTVNILVYKDDKKHDFILDNNKSFDVIALENNNENIYNEVFENLKKDLCKYMKDNILHKYISVDIGCTFGSINVYLYYNKLKTEYLGLYRMDKDSFYKLVLNDIYTCLQNFIKK